MMIIKVFPKPLKGTISVPPSKSMAHRFLICNQIYNCKKGINVLSYAQRLSFVNLYSNRISNDILVTAIGLDGMINHGLVECANSGSSARFLIPLAGAFGIDCTFNCDPYLKSRPFAHLLSALTDNGLQVKPNENSRCLLSTAGSIKPGEYTIPGNISSQFASGLLMALSYFDESSRLIVKKPVVSKPYIDITLDVLRQFGVNTSVSEDDFSITYTLSGINYCLPEAPLLDGDWSSGSFWLTANSLDNSICINGLSNDSLQGDKTVLEYLNALTNPFIEETPMDCSNTPDIVPPLALASSFINGTHVFTGIDRLSQKETDRINAIRNNLMLIGVSTTYTPKTKGGILIVEGIDEGDIIGSSKDAIYHPRRDSLVFDSYNDHRIAMMCILLANNLAVPSTILGVESLDKSYPRFLDDFHSLGGCYDIV